MTRLEELLADEFTLQGAAGQLDREEFLEAAAGPYEIDEFAYEQIDPEIYGNTAVLVSRYSQVARLDGRDLTHRMNVTDIWTRRDARWQIVRRHATMADWMSLQQSVASEHDAAPADLEARLETVRAAPRDAGLVEFIVRRPAVESARWSTRQCSTSRTASSATTGPCAAARAAARRTANAQVTLMGSRLSRSSRVTATVGRSPGDQLYVDLDLSRREPPARHAARDRLGRARGDRRAAHGLQEVHARASASRCSRSSTRPRAVRSTCAGSTRASSSRAPSASATPSEALTDTGRTPRGADASCPHAAAMSRPRVRRTVAGTRARSSSALKAAIAARDEPSYLPVGLYGMRFTLNPSRPRSRRAAAPEPARR